MASNGVLDARDRAAMLSRLATERFDVLVIGGGITGAGAALDAASRGLRVALVEARDLASGTSSRSSKLIHGGLRYLEQFDFKLVYEALRERDLLVSKLAPHLVKPVSFMYPLYKKVVERPYVGAGLVLYDAMEGPRRPVPHHRHLTARGALKRAPALSPDRLAGAMLYYDAQVDDARHTLTVARTAAAHSAVVATRVSAVGLLREADRRGRRRDAGDRRPGARRGNRARGHGDGGGRGGLRGGVDRPGARTGGGAGRLPGPDVQGRAHRGAAGGGGREHRDDPADRQERAVLHPWGGALDRRHDRHRLVRRPGRADRDRGGHRVHPGGREPGAGSSADPRRRHRGLRRPAAAGGSPRGQRLQAHHQAVQGTRGRRAGARAGQHRGRQVHHLPADGARRGGRRRGRLRPRGARVRHRPGAAARRGRAGRGPARSWGGSPRTTGLPARRWSTCSAGTGRSPKKC